MDQLTAPPHLPLSPRIRTTLSAKVHLPRLFDVTRGANFKDLWLVGCSQRSIPSTPINAHTMLFYFCCGCCIRSFIAHLHTYYSRCVHACRCTLLRDHDAADCWSRNLSGCISRFSLVLIVAFDVLKVPSISAVGASPSRYATAMHVLMNLIKSASLMA